MSSKKQNIKLAVVISDTHVGSTVGLWPDKFNSVEGFSVGQNAIQKWLWKLWLDATQKWLPSVVGDDPYALIVNGDLIDGVSPRSIQVMTPDPADQSRAVKQVLGPMFQKAAKTYITLGTESHSRNDEYRIGADLGAEIDQETGLHAFSELHLEIHGAYGICRHHCGTAGSPYVEAGGIGRAMNTEIMEAARCGARIPKWMMRAHRHRHGVVTDGNSMMGITGAWQTLTRFGHKVVPAAQAQPSMVILDWRGTQRGDLPRIHEKVYEPKKKHIITVS
jgi:hypothetical protein